MTEATTGTGPNATVLEILSRTGMPKTGLGNQRTGGASINGGVAKPVDAQDLRHEVQGSDATSVGRALKPSTKTRGDNNAGDETDALFALTIDSIDQRAAENTRNITTPGPPQLVGWSPQVSADNTESDASCAAVSNMDNAVVTQGSPRLPNLLKQESVAALLETRQRLISDGDNSEIVDVMPATLENLSETITSSITVHSRETHWRFAIQPKDLALTGSGAMGMGGATANPLAALSHTDPRAKEGEAPVLTQNSAETLSALGFDARTANDRAAGDAFDGDRDNRRGLQERTANRINAPASANSGPEKSADRLSPQPVEAKSTNSVSTDNLALGSGLSRPTEQIRTGILNALNHDAGDVAPKTSLLTLQDRPAGVGQVVRTIDLTLSPADLGSVRLRLTLNSNALSIEAEASKASTARLLNDDRKNLEQNLRDAGYDVSLLKITDTAASAAANSNGTASGGSAFQDGQARASFSARQEGDQRHGGAMPDEAGRRQKEDDPQRRPSSDSLGSRQTNAIYI
jgi:chemotaxis protein MotD